MKPDDDVGLSVDRSLGGLDVAAVAAAAAADQYTASILQPSV